MMITDFIAEKQRITEELDEVNQAIRERDGNECRRLKALVQKKERLIAEL
jgi:hypothetical protein